MRIAIVGTYPPTACGIATFTADISHSLGGAGLGVDVVPVIQGDETTDATIHIDKDDRSSYISAAQRLSGSNVDAVLIEHEFGIFTGHAGNSIVDFIDALTIPLAVTLHTVLSPYSPAQAEVIRRLCDRAVVVTVFTATARRLLLEQELVHADIVSVVPHGAPMELYATFDRSAVRDQFGIGPADRLISTFGLLSPGKGIELALTALVEIVEKHPRTMYVIAGRTHPEIERRDGQCYRQGLLHLIDELGLVDHVRIIDRFLEVRELAELLSITEVFCTPYVGSDQTVSGALTFAVAAGCAVVSTPYRYARDLLAHGAGILVDFDDAPAFARAVSELLDDGPRAEAARTAARIASSEMKWPTVGKALADLLSAAIVTRRAIALGSLLSVNPSTAQVELGSVACDPPIDSMPPALHLSVLVDDTSVLQHARGLVPRIDAGYCVDDAGRVLPILAAVAADARARGMDPSRWHIALARQMSFLRAATAERSTMRNFMSWERRWLDEPHHGDHVGRAVWGLGELAAMDSDYSDDALELMLDITDGFDPRRASARTLAYMALGLEAAHEDPTAMDHLQRCAPSLREWRPRSGTWRWFEDRLAYDNPRLAETMLRVGYRLDDPQLSEAGADQLEWLESLCRRADHYRFPGHLGADAHHDVRWSGDEQPLEASAMADAHAARLRFDDDTDARISIDRAWTWFLGNNRLGVPVGDIATGACHDGLCSHDVNRNCGAESTISFMRCARTWSASRAADGTDTTKETHHVPAE